MALRTWYIEDAGGGCKAFPEIVVLVSEEPQEIHTATIPLTWESGESYEELVRKKVVTMMSEAGVSKEDHILVCSGNIFYGLHAWLSQEKYQWETTKMDGLAHEVAEDTFYQQIVKAGFPPHIKMIDRNYKDFYHEVEKWVQEEESRHLYLKDRLVRQKPLKSRYLLRGNGSHQLHCSHCKKTIMPYTPMVEVKYRQKGKKIKKQFHPICSPIEPTKNKLKSFIGILHHKPVTGILAVNKTETCCSICQQPISLGEEAFFFYPQKTTLAVCHLSCITPMLPRTE